jgi:hypothetical protein
MFNKIDSLLDEQNIFFPFFVGRTETFVGKDVDLNLFVIKPF